jgi:hypothetical protein
MPSYRGNRSGPRSPPWGVNLLRVDVHPSVVLLCLVTKILLKVPLPMLAHTLWLLGNGAGFSPSSQGWEAFGPSILLKCGSFESSMG